VPQETADPRIDLILDRLARRDFVASEDLRGLLSGHSIPSKRTVRQILARIPRVKSGYRVLLIGAGSGYLPAVLGHLAAEVVAVEKDAAVARIAVANLQRTGLDNVEVVVGHGEDGHAERAPFDLVISGCFLQRTNTLLGQLAEGGSLVTLEGADAQAPELVQYRKRHDEAVRRSLGPVSFHRGTGEILIDLGYVDEAALADARKEAKRRDVSVLDVVRRRLHLADAELYRSLAVQHGLAFARAEDLLGTLDTRLFHEFSTTFLDNQRLVPIRVDRDRLVVATDNPESQTDDIRRMHPYADVERVLVTPTDFRRLWSNIDITTRGRDVLQWREGPEPHSRIKDLLESSEREISHHLVSIYEAILLDAVSAGASDIHVERYGERVRIRLRTDGELHDLDYYQLTPAEHAGLINVIKVQAEINIAERRLPQGGRSQMRVGRSNYDLRVQIQPSLHAEHAVIRLLSQSGRVLGMEELGMSARVSSAYRRLLDNPSGLVLVVGPTGSGKSTTLYAGLQLLADDGRRKVITVEDPIEYSIDNIQQTRVRTEIGFGFADAMRSFVRQDPDVILVGEIRDHETALEAMRASQTGHVVLSTLHCNDSVDALQRLYDLGIHPNSIAGELLAVIAQRLAKRICTACREEVEPDPAIVAELFPDDVPAGFRCFEGSGCSECRGRGTRGRIAIVEYLHVTDAIRRFISTQPSVSELRWQALDSGLITMRDSALDHVIEGIIPLTELPRLLPQERMAPEQRGGLRPR
jgi:type IV pilus assembly protein PilB